MAPIPLANIIGMLAGALILGVGVFVLKAKPGSALHRLFFALAVADGLSTFTFALATSQVGDELRLASFLIYYYSFVAFIGLLLLFGLRFPRPALGRSPRWIGGWLVMGVVIGTWAIHTIDPSAFWIARLTATGLSFEVTAGGRVVNSAFYGVIALIILRITTLTLREPSESHRRQGVLVLSGMALGYAPVATTAVLTGLGRGLSGSFFAPQLDRLVIYWSSLLTLVVILVALVRLLPDTQPDRRVERRVLLGCLFGVLIVTSVGLLASSAGLVELLKKTALLAYPILLMYAIMRYEVLDMHAHLRRAAALSLLGAAATVVFFVFEALLENVLQGFFASQTSSSIAAALVAAGITAAASAPLARFARRIGAKIAPKPPVDIHARQKEIYRHALEGAAADGLVERQELEVLKRLRASLAISDADHEMMLRDISTRAA